MQQHALDATRRAGQRITTGPWSRPTAAAATPPNPQPETPQHDCYNDYPETEPMSDFMDCPPSVEEPAHK